MGQAIKLSDLYIDLDGQEISLVPLDAAERKLVARLQRRARPCPGKRHPSGEMWYFEQMHPWTRALARIKCTAGKAPREARRRRAVDRSKVARPWGRKEELSLAITFLHGRNP